MRLFLKGIFLALISFLPAQAQILDPVEWAFSSKAGNAPDEVILLFTAEIDPGWSLYATEVEEGGPIPTSFAFQPSPQYELIGKPEEQGEALEKFDPIFKMQIRKFKNKAVFSQKIRLLNSKTTISGTLEFMVCDNTRCLPPEEVAFEIPVAAIVQQTQEPPKQNKIQAEEVEEPAVRENGSKETEETAPQKEQETGITEETLKQEPLAVPEKKGASDSATLEELPVNDISLEVPDSEQITSGKMAGTGENPENPSESSLWTLFFAGFVGGIAAFLMPCIFPMLPLTISFFTKGAGSKGNAVGRSMFYGISIIGIYVSLGLLITILFGADTLNSLSTNGVLNFLFFLLLVVFAASFLGAFELTLPSKWTTKIDTEVDKGGMLGIFFMAFALAVVSFSCTGPIIGTLLVQAASMGEVMGPAIGMVGFSLALALPFTLFSLFPRWMQSLPRSGGWLNSVKVVLGLLELALAFKFLSNVDLAYHWEWFDRELFLSLWIVIFGILGLYLLGKIRFPNDSETTVLSPLRAFLAIGVLAFTIYMVPGLWGAPLKSISAFLPPQHTQDFDLYTPSLYSGPATSKEENLQDRKYAELFHAPLNLTPFFDYEEGFAYARKVGKPVLIDFTGHACVNCRKMEATVWPDPQVLRMLKEDFVLIQLYVDDKTELPEKEQYISDFSGKKITTIGEKWSDLQATKFGANSQPYYVLMSPEEELLAPPKGADYEVANFISFLQEGIIKQKTLSKKP